MMRIVLAAGVLLALLATSAGAMPQHKLKMFEARSAAESSAFDFEQRQGLDSSTVGRCERKTSRRVVCAARATGETARRMTDCSLRIRVHAVYRTFYWDEVASVIHRSCRSNDKPYLPYPAALAAIQAEANHFAATTTTITAMSREDDRTFSGRAEWTRINYAAVCGAPDYSCKYDPMSEELVSTPKAEACSVTLTAKLTESVEVAVQGFSCY